MRTLITFLAFAALSLCYQPARAKSNDYVRMIEAGEPINITSDKAYALVRLQSHLKLFNIIIMRIPSDDEMAGYEAAKSAAYAKSGRKAGGLDKFDFTYDGVPNLFSVPFKRELMELSDGRMVLAELPAGEYVLYGEGFSGFLVQCFCLGTVRFTLKPGVVTDLGTIALDYAWSPATIPELVPVSGQGVAAKMDYAVMAVGLRPTREGDVLPPGLIRSQIETAGFHAVGPFVDSETQLISQLAPVAGVLAYDNGQVVDVATGKVLSENE